MNSRQTIKLFSVVLIALSAAFVAFIGWPRAAMTQQTSQKSQATPTIDEYQPKSTLVTKEHKVERAKFPFIDIHSHQCNPPASEMHPLVKEMHNINLRVLAK